MSSLNYSRFCAVLGLGLFLVLVSQLQIYPANASQNKLLDVPELHSDNNLTIDTNNSTEFTTYKDEDFRFEILYPSDWIINTKDLQYDMVTFSSPNYDVNVNVKLIPREKHETLKQFGDKTFKNNDDFRINEYYRNTNTTFAGLPAIKMIGTFL